MMSWISRWQIAKGSDGVRKNRAVSRPQRGFSGPSALLFSSVLLLGAFQNCGGIFPSSPLLFDSKEVFFNSEMAKADFYWLVRADQSNLSRNQLGWIKKWIDQGSYKVSLYPPFMPQTQLPDTSRSARFMDSPQATRVLFQPTSFLSSHANDSFYLASEKYSILLYLNEITFPTQRDPHLGAQGRVSLLSLTSEAHPQDGNLTIELIHDPQTHSYEAHFYQWFDGPDFYFAKAPIKEEEMKSGLAFGLSFGAADMEPPLFAINGTIRNTEGRWHGNTTPFHFAPRTLSINRVGEGLGVAQPLSNPSNSNEYEVASAQGQLDATTGQFATTTGQFALAELGVFKRALSQRELEEFTMGLHTNYQLHRPIHLSQLTTLNGFQNTSADLGTQAAPVSFAQIQPLFNKTIGVQSCASCHTEVSSRSELLLANRSGQPWVVPGAPLSSLLIESLKHGGGASPMPKGGGQMLPADIHLIETWILQGAK